MHPFQRPYLALRAWAGALTLATLTACGGGLDPLLGTPPVGAAPAVTLTSPLASIPAVTGVDTNTRVMATFSRPMDAATITADSFTLECPAGTPVDASVSYDAPTQVATLVPTTALAPSTTCVATVGDAVRDASGIAMAGAFVWSFVTGPAAPTDKTRPTVTFTVPADAADAVATNSRVTATFSEAMDAATISVTSFKLRNDTLGTAVTGSVSYNAASRSARFTPSTPSSLAASSQYTATVTTAATDVAGNPLAGRHRWTFTTGAAADTVAPLVASVSPAGGATAVCRTQGVSVTFSEAMDAETIDATSFIVDDDSVALLGTIRYDAASRVASFMPAAPTGFEAGRTLTVTIVSGASGVKDLAGNALAADRVWTFTTGNQACLGPVALGTAASFGAFGGAAGVTNQGVNTVVGGNLGTTAACTLMTGFHDAVNVYTETPLNIGQVNGSIHCAPPAPGTATTLAIARQALADARSAYQTLAALPAGSDPGAGQLGGLVLAPGVYTAAGGSFDVTTGNLTLDAQGNANAVWVFQSASALTVGQTATPRRVLLINGAQAKNVFWQVGSAARIEDGSTMVGTVIAPAGVTVSTAGQTAQTTLIGRAIGLTASVTLVNTTIVAP